MKIATNIKISVVANLRPGQSVEPPPKGRDAAAGRWWKSVSTLGRVNRDASNSMALDPQLWGSLCKTAAGIWMMDPALSRYLRLRMMSFWTHLAERLVEWWRRTSCKVELRSGHRLFKAVMESLASLHPCFPLLDSTATLARSSDRMSWRSLTSVNTWKSIQSTAGTVLTKRPIHVVSSKRAWSSYETLRKELAWQLAWIRSAPWIQSPSSKYLVKALATVSRPL